MADKEKRMSKSRYSKTKAAGMLTGMTRHKNGLKSRQAGAVFGLSVDNRQMRRLKGIAHESRVD